MHRQLLPALACVVIACEQPPEPPTSPALTHASHAAPLPSAAAGGAERDVARRRALTASFHNFESAVKAGWGTKITECFSDARLGGMGYHYGNTALIDGVVDAQQP